MEKIKTFVLCAIFVLVFGGGIYTILNMTPNKPCDDINQQNCTYERMYGVTETQNGQ